MKKLKLVIVCFVIGGWITAVYAFSSGPPAAHTGAPGESTCTKCHTGNPLNSGGGSILIAGLPKNYIPGTRYNLTVTVLQSGRQRWGFQITALADNGASTGEFILTDTNFTQRIAENVAGKSRVYVEHTNVGTQSGSQNSGAFKLDWTAPTNDVGTITFYAAGNAANGDGTNSGDNIYTTNIKVPPTIVDSSPVIQSVTPSLGSTEGETEITVTGNGFSQGAILRIGSHEAEITTISSNEIKAKTQPGLPGTYDVFVTNPNGKQATKTLAFTYQGNDPKSLVLFEVPNGGNILSSGGLPFKISWKSIANSSAKQKIELSIDRGINFDKLVAELTNESSSFIYAVPADITTTKGRLRIIVDDINKKNFDISDEDFTIVQAPTIISISPNIVTANSQVKKFKIIGTLFKADSVIEINGTPVTTKINSSSMILAKNIKIPASGPLNIRIHNADGGISKEIKVEVK